MPCYAPLQGYSDFVTGGLTFKKSKSAYKKMEVACGQCLGCRLDRSRMWAMRICHEASLHEYAGGNCFITLTYDQDNIPENWSLDKTHFQKFMKRLRKANEQKIRFFHCGEYGDICRHGKSVTDCPGCGVGRPHYHAILFNKSFQDMEQCGIQNGTKYYTSPELQAHWGKGFVQVGEVNMESAAYVARYCIKKINGQQAEEHYITTDHYGETYPVIPEYATMSRGGRHGKGLAHEWFEKYKKDVYPSDEVPVPGASVYKKVPRYYDSLLERSDPVLLESVKTRRQQFRQDNKEEYSPQRLEAKYKVKQSQIQNLKRNL